MMQIMNEKSAKYISIMIMLNIFTLSLGG